MALYYLLPDPKSHGIVLSLIRSGIAWHCIISYPIRNRMALHYLFIRIIRISKDITLTFLYLYYPEIIIKTVLMLPVWY